MRTRGAGRGIVPASRPALAATALVAALALSACGSKDFPNDPRAPSPIDVTAKISSDEVLVSPSRFGSGLVTFTIANLTHNPARFTITGPKDAATQEILPGTPGTLKVNLTEGTYQAGSGANSKAKPTTLRVGSDRASPQNKVLLP